MPTLKIQTNARIAPERRKAIMEAASSTIAGALGKPEAYIMVILDSNPDMLFAADDAPLAYLELKSLGLPENGTNEISAHLCDFMARHLGVPQSRVYIEFASPPRHMFGWNGSTF